MWLISRLTAGEKIAAAVFSRLMPWLTPIPTAYMVYRAATTHLAWPVWVAVIAAVIVESVGISATFITLDMRRYNGRRGQADQAAPVKAGYVLIAGYTLAAAILTVLLDIAPILASGAGLIFVALSLAGVMVIGLNHDHDRRLEAQADRIAGEIADKQRREEARRLDKIDRIAAKTPPAMSGQTADMSTDKPALSDNVQTSAGQKPAMSKADRHAELTGLAMSGQTINESFIVSRYQVSPKTAGRDILELNGKLKGENNHV